MMGGLQKKQMKHVSGELSTTPRAWFNGYSYSEPEDPILLLWRNLSNILYVDGACRP